MHLPTYLTGFSMGLGLILAIGAQNAFVLRQGLRGEHVLAVCLACALSDALLIAIGVAGFGHMVALLPQLEPVMRYAGAAFLAWYGLRSLRSALASTEALAAAQGGSLSLKAALGTTLALTFLNPHVYLDTVVLLGSVSTQFEGARASFAAGAMTASVLFFFSLGFGAAFARPLFARPGAWRLLEGAIAIVMWTIALRLVFGA
ncbi:LysE/ArgO family amino acid transporter [Aureimonas frigidaquae]|uniref:LysE/ArgO family amino acid transporter n=1 Tax=Aureimonas frigidaquae TaxID=424757 RepID=UPI0007851340|nr:LysE/ArgO family amino acid transporter [Aureimonas frigidaquae]